MSKIQKRFDVFRQNGDFPSPVTSHPLWIRRLKIHVLTHGNAITVLFVTIYFTAAVIEAVTAVGLCDTALIGAGKLVGFTF